MTEVQKNPETQTTPERKHEGPSWGMMLVFIGMAMVVALAIAWAFIHPLLERR